VDIYYNLYIYKRSNEVNIFNVIWASYQQLNWHRKLPLFIMLLIVTGTF